MVFIYRQQERYAALNGGRETRKEAIVRALNCCVHFFPLSPSAAFTVTGRTQPPLLLLFLQTLSSPYFFLLILPPSRHTDLTEAITAAAAALPAAATHFSPLLPPPPRERKVMVWKGLSVREELSADNDKTQRSVSLT